MRTAVTFGIFSWFVIVTANYHNASHINDLRVTVDLNCEASGVGDRQHSSHCFEIPLWHQRPVRLHEHLARVRGRWRGGGGGEGHSWERGGRSGGAGEPRADDATRASLGREVSRYMETVLTPFLDTYYESMRSILEQLTGNMRRRGEDEMRAATALQLTLQAELAGLAERLQIPAMCDEERRRVRTVAGGHVARVYRCVQRARADVDKIAAYVAEIIRVTRQQMDRAVQNAVELHRINGTATIGSGAPERRLSQTAVELGFELDLSLTNTRRHSEQSCKRLAKCSARARRDSNRDAARLTDEMNQCVYA